ncbi:SH3 domain-containing protein [Emcibacter nanhaiensis]|uniref:SH3 domain-containing protein n=1 Tax=Emcibacter nanhaiensis TaxID=1505037 RepID=A0A501PA84_9PROT|nr:SH3 domain-containing protein [Emcibacter nanhaiensis]TPD57280.1 SH3 domain-containing protein [Emcibacter nanhaiensis]
MKLRFGVFVASVACLAGLAVVPAQAQFGGFLKNAVKDAATKEAMKAAGFEGLDPTNPDSYKAYLKGKVTDKVSGEFSKMLSKEDVETQSASVRDTIYSGESTSWSNPDTGASGENKVVKESTKEKKEKITVMKDKVEEIPPLNLIGMNYEALETTAVRGGPGTDYKEVDQLEAGEVINVIGKVQESDWYMVSAGGAASGYVHSALLMEAFDKSITDTTVPEGKTKKVKTKVSKTCKEVEQAVTGEDSKTKVEKLKVCQSPNGWEVT